MKKFLRILSNAATSRHGTCSKSPNRSLSWRQIHSDPPQLASFGIAFDIDGVILRGDTPIGGSPQALRRLYDPSGEVIQGHSPFKKLVPRFENELIIAVGKGEPAVVMSEYGFKNVLSIDQYASYFENIDPLSHFKHCTDQLAGYDRCSSKEKAMQNDPCSQRVKAVFIVSDSVDWSRDIQVLCDILSTGGLPGKERSCQPPLYFANDDLSYQGLFPTERLGMGAFRIALESIYNSTNVKAMQYTSYGKPNPSVFKNAENVLMQVVRSTIRHHNIEQNPFKTLYMIGDNPSVDIRGAKEVCSQSQLNRIITDYGDIVFHSQFQFTDGASLVFYLDKDWSFQGDEAYPISSRHGS